MYLLKACHVPSIVLGTRNRAMNRIHKSSPQGALHSRRGRSSPPQLKEKQMEKKNANLIHQLQSELSPQGCLVHSVFSCWVSYSVQQQFQTVPTLLKICPLYRPWYSCYLQEFLCRGHTDHSDSLWPEPTPCCSSLGFPFPWASSWWWHHYIPTVQHRNLLSSWSILLLHSPLHTHCSGQKPAIVLVDPSPSLPTPAHSITCGLLWSLWPKSFPHSTSIHYFAFCTYHSSIH